LLLNLDSLHFQTPNRRNPEWSQCLTLTQNVD